MNGDEQPGPVWRWPVEWATSKRFWENVASNIVATWITAAAGLAFVLAAGLLPSHRAYVTAAWFASMTLAVVSFIIAGSSFGTWLSAMTFRFHVFRGPEDEKLRLAAFAGLIFGLICIITVIGVFLNWPEHVGTYLWKQDTSPSSPTT